MSGVYLMKIRLDSKFGEWNKYMDSFRDNEEIKWNLNLTLWR